MGLEMVNRPVSIRSALDVTGTVDTFIGALGELREPQALDADLHELAHFCIRPVTQPHGIQQRRRVISQTTRFPEPEIRMALVAPNDCSRWPTRYRLTWSWTP